MTITMTSRELTKKESYKMTLAPTIKKMRDIVGAQIDVSAFILYEDVNSDGKEQEILSVMDADGTVYATNSPTFKKDFAKIYEIMDGEDFSIEVISGTSKAGREFITCTLM